MTTPGVLLSHPSGLTDSFTLFVKAVVILDRVRTFNTRFRLKYPSARGGSVDPRLVPEFKELDETIETFVGSFPREFKNPLHGEDGNKLDPILYLTHLLPHTCVSRVESEMWLF